MKYRAHARNQASRRKSGRPPGSKNKVRGALSANADGEDEEDRNELPKIMLNVLIQAENGKLGSTLMVDSSNVAASDSNAAVPSASSIRCEVVNALQSESFWPSDPDDAESVEKSLVLYTGSHVSVFIFVCTLLLCLVPEYVSRRFGIHPRLTDS